MYLVDQPPNDIFTAPELERLAAYRAAVAAGFYTDWDGTAATTDTQALAWLASSDDPLTADERQRLDRLRQDVADGRYADDQPIPTPTAAPTDNTSGDAAR